MPRTRKKHREHVDIVRSFECPHCLQEIELVGQKEFDEDEELRKAKLSPNKVVRLRSVDGSFPLPALVFPNRTMWKRSDIEAYIRLQQENKVRGIVDDIFTLPRDEAEEALRQLSERLQSKV